MKIARAVCALAFLAGVGAASTAFGLAIVIDHTNTDLRVLPQTGLEAAKASLHIAYGHTSHGSQVTDGMSGLVGFINGGGLGLSYPANFFNWNHGGTGGALDLHDYFRPGNLGAPDFTQWAAETRNYLRDPANAGVNVVMWSWCGQVSWSTEADINTYLGLMDGLQQDYPNVRFVHMTGHTDGDAPGGNLLVRNQQIRDHCATHGGILFDFADIESWDPDGNYYGDKLLTDNCDYDSDGNGSRDRNWAVDWQDTHTEGVDWYNCSAAHSQALNGNRKAYAAWALWNEIAAALAPATLHWKGAVGHTWDLGQTANWSRSGAMRGYQDGDDVVFDDTASGTPLVNLAGTVQPGSVLVDNDAVDFAFTGAGSIAGPCGLTKRGGGTLTLAAANAYTGDTRIEGGTLIVAAEGALGASAVTLGDAAGPSDASLLVSGAFTVDRPVTVRDDGSETSSRVLGGTHTAGTASFSGGLTLSGGVTLTAATGGTVRLAAALDNSGGHTIAKTGPGTVVFDGAQTHGPGARLDVGAGTVDMNTDAGSAAAANLSVAVTGAAMNFGCGQHLASLEVTGGAARLAAGGSNVLVAGALLLASDASLDLADGGLVVDYAPGASPAAAVAGWIGSGFHDGPGGYWDGPGIASSVAAADADLLTAVGVLDNTDTKVGGKTAFAGEAVDATSVLAKYTWWGDANLDGVVDANDYDVIDKNYLFDPTPEMPWFTGDFTYDGVIDANDYDRIDKAYLFQTGPLGPADGVAPVPAPEPATLALLAAGLGAVAVRKRTA